MRKMLSPRGYAAAVYLSAFLAILPPSAKADASVGLHKTQNVLIPSSVLVSNQHMPLRHLEIHQTMELNLSSMAELKRNKVSWLEIDSTFIEDLKLLSVSYGVLKEKKLDQYVVYDGKHLPLPLFISALSKTGTPFKFWIDLKNLTEDNAKGVCEYLKGSFTEEELARIYVESPKANGLLGLRRSGCPNLIFWLGGTDLSKMSFIKRLLFKLKINYLVRPSYVSQSFSGLERNESFFPSVPKAIWTNQIEKSYPSPEKLKLAIEDLKRRSGVILFDWDLLKKQ